MRARFWLGLLVTLALLAAIGIALWFTVTLGESFGQFPQQGIFVEIPRGVSLHEIARRLADAGVVRDPWAFEMLARWRGRPLLAGEYRFQRARTSYEVYDILVNGRIYLQSLVIPEGKTMFEIAALVAQGHFGTEEQFLEAARDPALLPRFDKPATGSLEGFLFPATYQFPRRTSPREIAAAMLRRFNEEWKKQRGRDLREKLSVPELVTLASLVERETRVADERPLVAAVFYNRLRRGMALECDPTVIYALTLAGRYRGTLYRPDMRFNSPYNTYRHRGLPPGPIANPGAASLHAALNPAETDYLYFVADGQGGHVFSATLREHINNVAHYRRLMRLSSPEPVAEPDPPKPAPKPKPAPPSKPQKRARKGGSR